MNMSIRQIHPVFLGEVSGIGQRQRHQTRQRRRQHRRYIPITGEERPMTELPKYERWPGYEQASPFVRWRYCRPWGRGA
jgi:hypothetical protein